MMIDELKLVKKIGSGVSKVYLSSKEGDNSKYTLVIIKKTKSRKESKYLNNEISILMDTNHPNIIKLFEIKETKKKIYLVIEYCNGGTLQNFLEKNNPPSEEIVQFLMKQIIDAIKYLHNKKIVHRDLCFYNIMINYEDENDRINNNIIKSKIKIIEFELARYLQKGKLSEVWEGPVLRTDPIFLFKIKGIPEYKNAGFDEKADIWSLGILFYQLLVGKNPFETDDLDDLDGLVEKIKNGDYYVPTTLSKEAISFLNCMLQLDPKKRKSIDILYNHKFLRKNSNQFTKINENIKLSEIKLNIKENNELFNE